MKLTTFRLSTCIFTIFLVIGIYLPFLPTWLEGRGLSAGQVGTIFAVALWLRIPVGLLLAAVTDATGRRKSVLLAISLIICLGFIAFKFMDGYWALLLGWLVVGTLLTSAIPLMDNLIMMTIGKRKADYGRIRLWGSISFIAASILGGMYLQGRDSESILDLLIAGSV
ncbi:MAG TPA: MFS transporter, partial [Rhodospirillales bacterium]|nr:MFS transporter [Rhodospirillales bacterium]